MKLFINCNYNWFSKGKIFFVLCLTLNPSPRGEGLKELTTNLIGTPPPRPWERGIRGGEAKATWEKGKRRNIIGPFPLTIPIFFIFLQFI
jgi:hypothetical protein